MKSFARMDRKMAKEESKGDVVESREEADDDMMEAMMEVSPDTMKAGEQDLGNTFHLPIRER